MHCVKKKELSRRKIQTQFQLPLNTAPITMYAPRRDW